jgi:hypothetical protein
LWFVIGAEMFSKTKAGQFFSNHKAKISDLSCGCKDSANGIGGFNHVSCDAVRGGAAPFNNVKCQGVQHSPLVQRYCPTACGATVCGPRIPGPSPSPRPKPEIQQTCRDRTHTGLRVGGQEAACRDLLDYCHQSSRVQQACCETCAGRAEHGVVGNGECRDESDPQIQGYNCAELANSCSQWSSVQERCCATCKKANAGTVESQCVDANRPNIHDWMYRRKSCAWAKRKGFCRRASVKNECCKTCST